MKPQRVLLAGLLVATVLLTGCIWLRLLELKNQFAEFDRYVKVDDRHGLAFEFVKPVLYSKDVFTLLELDPTARATNGAQLVWSWTLEKVPATNEVPEGLDLTFTTTFTKDKLTGFTIPERFLAFVPKDSIVAMARAMGHAQVDQKNRSATGHFRSDDPHGDTNRLSRAELTQMLGAPLAVNETKAGYALLYEYRLKSPSLKQGESMLARARCEFRRDTDKLDRVEVRYGDLRLNFAFDEKH